VHEQRSDQLHGLLGVVDRDVHVHSEDELAPRHVLELVDEGPVAVAGGDALSLEEAERVRAGRTDPEVLLAREAGHVPAQLP
jgi:hypothetical protein